MPTPKSKRDVILRSSFSSTNVVATLNLSMDAQFTTPTGATTINLFENASSGNSNEDTDYQMTFNISSTASVGVITISFFGRGDNPVSGLTVDKTRAVSDIDPSPTTTTVTPIASPDAYYTRSWQQEALDSSEVGQVDQTGGVDMRVKASAGYSVTQTVTSTDEHHLVITYSFKGPTGAEVVGGTVTFDATAVAGANYSLGKLEVSDSSSGSGSGSGLRLTSGRLSERVPTRRGHGSERRGRGRDRDERDDRRHDR